MGKLTLIFFMILASCRSKPFAEDLLADGKTWKVTTYDIRCDSGMSACKRDATERVATRARVLCDSDSVKVLTCDIRPLSYQLTDATCLVRCDVSPRSNNSSALGPSDP